MVGDPTRAPCGGSLWVGWPRRVSLRRQLRDLAQTRNRFLAQHMANVLFYPADVAEVPGAARPIREALALIGAMAAGAGLVFVGSHLRIARRGRLQAVAQPA